MPYMGICFFYFYYNDLYLSLAGFSSCDELFSQTRDSSAIAGSYAYDILNQLLQFSELGHSTHIGALIIEPGK